MVCIIDDREDVWKFAPNLITVKKYVYFQGIGDINAPSGPREPQARKRGGWPPRPADRTLASVSCLCCGSVNSRFIVKFRAMRLLLQSLK